jgi:hypothetical protein
MKKQYALVVALLLTGCGLRHHVKTATAPRATAHQVTLTSKSAACKADTSCQNPPYNQTAFTNCLCNLQVWRARGSTGGWVQLQSAGSAAVDSTGTAWTFKDNDPGLTDGSTWNYYETVSWQQDTTGAVSPPTNTVFVTVPTSAPAHQATLNYTSSACTLSQGCWIQLYRATCASSVSCPDFKTNPGAYTQLANVQIPIWNTDANGTTWQLIDADPALADGTAYAWVSTLCWANTCPAYSDPSPVWIGLTPGALGAPTVGAGNTVSMIEVKNEDAYNRSHSDR